MTTEVITFPTTCAFEGRHYGCSEALCECGCVARGHNLIEVPFNWQSALMLQKYGSTVMMHEGPCESCVECEKYAPEVLRQMTHRNLHAEHRKMPLSQMFIVCAEECGKEKLDWMTRAENAHIRRAAAQFISKRQLPGYDKFLVSVGHDPISRSACPFCGEHAKLVQRGEWQCCPDCASTGDWIEANVLDEHAEISEGEVH